jgi:hypothetical protein
MLADRRSCWSVLVPALVAAALAACAPTGDPSFEFALVGDNPYPPEHVPRFEALIEDVNRHRALRWVIHVGDIQSGQQCTDELFQSRFDLYQRFAAAFVYTPGDNDWFDCEEEDRGGYDEYERLRYLRGLFFPDPSRTTGGRPLAVRSQSTVAGYEAFVENAMWTHRGVMFSTVHLVAITRPPTDQPAAERRMDAALAWIAETFAIARDSGSVGVFIAMQADPWFVSGLPGLIRGLCERCLEPRGGLDRLYPVLVEESLAYGRPVVLAVGDSHVFRVDKPLYRTDGRLVENFTRIEAFGSPSVHWVRVSVDPQRRDVFAFHQEIVPGNVAERRVR